MKYFFLLLMFMQLLFACTNEESINNKSVTKYYNTLNDSDFSELKTVISDSLTIIEGDFVMPFSKKEYYEQFKWDSIFKPTYEIVEIKNIQSQVIATVAVNSVRFKFLKNNPLTCRHKISFKSGKITKIESLDCIGVDWAIWEKERDSLVAWININHPEIDGFINDLSMNGATKYLKAIKLYELHNNHKIQ